MPHGSNSSLPPDPLPSDNPFPASPSSNLSIPVSAPAPAPAHVHAPVSAPVPAPVPAPVSAHALVPDPVPAPFSAPVRAPVPVPVSAPVSSSVPVPAPRTSFSRQRNRMGLRVDVEMARRKSLSEAASEQWNLSTDIHEELNNSGEAMMMECSEEFYEDDWRLDEDKDKEDLRRLPEDEDGDDFAFDDNIAFLTHLEAVTVEDSASDSDEDGREDPLSDDDYDDELEVDYEADYRVEERFFLHTIQEDSFEKEDAAEMDDASYKSEDCSSLEDHSSHGSSLKESNCPERNETGDQQEAFAGAEEALQEHFEKLGEESLGWRMTADTIEEDTKDNFMRLRTTSPFQQLGKNQDSFGLTSAALSLQESIMDQADGECILPPSADSPFQRGQGDTAADNSLTPSLADSPFQRCQGDTAADSSLTPSLTDSPFQRGQGDTAADSSLTPSLTDSPFQRGQGDTGADNSLTPSLADSPFQVEALYGATDETFAIPLPDTPFQRGGLDRSTIRSKRGQRRRNNSQSSSQPTTGASPADGRDREQSADNDDVKDATFDHVTLRKPAIRHSLEKREHQADHQPNHEKKKSLKVDIKTWEERRGLKTKPLPLKCIFSTDI